MNIAMAAGTIAVVYFLLVGLAFVVGMGLRCLFPFHAFRQIGWLGATWIVLVKILLTGGRAATAITVFPDSGGMPGLECVANGVWILASVLLQFLFVQWGARTMDRIKNRNPNTAPQGTGYARP